MSDNDRLKQIVELQDMNAALHARVGVLETGIRQLADEWECPDLNGEYGYSATVHREACMWCRGADELRELLALDHTDTGSRDE